MTVGVKLQFMKTLEGGCTAAIGGNAKITGDTIYFKGILIAIDGSEKVEVEKSVPLSEWNSLGKSCAEEVLINGGNCGKNF